MNGQRTIRRQKPMNALLSGCSLMAILLQIIFISIAAGQNPQVALQKSTLNGAGGDSQSAQYQMTSTLAQMTSPGFASGVNANLAAGFLTPMFSVNQPPVWQNLPDTVLVDSGDSTSLNIWDFAEDAETPDSLLDFQFSSSSDSLQTAFNPTTGFLSITAAAGFYGNTYLGMTVADPTGAATSDTLTVRIREITSIIDAPAAYSPEGFQLRQNYPNPFNPSTTIEFLLPNSGFVTLEIFNILGESVQALLATQLPAGSHRYDWVANDLPSGVYIYKLTLGNQALVRKALLLK